MSDSQNNRKLTLLESFYKKESNLKETNKNNDEILDAVAYGNLNALQYLHKSEYDLKAANEEHSLLYLAAENGHLDVFQYLIANGFSPDFEEGSELLIAANCGNLPIVKELVKLGVDPEIQDGEAFVRAAGMGGYLAVVDYFVGHCGVDVNIQNGSALFQAAWKNRLNVVQYLLKQGARTNIPGLLSGAITSRNIKIFKLLVEYGADAKSDDGDKALRLATYNNMYDIVEYLEAKRKE